MALNIKNSTMQSNNIVFHLNVNFYLYTTIMQVFGILILEEENGLKMYFYTDTDI